MKQDGSGFREDASERKSSRLDTNANWVWRSHELEEQARKENLIAPAKSWIHTRGHPGDQKRKSGIVSSGAPKLAGTRHFGRLAGTAIVVLGVAAAYLYLGGWFNRKGLTPARFADGFERVDGIHSGFRLNHAKGVCVTGSFESNGRGTRLSKAVVFKAGRVPIIGRFSLAGGNPYVVDKPEMVRGLGLLFKLPDGEEWRTAMINTVVFGVHTPQAFYDRLFASQPDPKTGKPDPEKMARFLANHPETVAAAKIIKSHPPSSGFDNTTFYGLNAFWFTNARGRSIPVRWWVAPMQPFAPANTTGPAPPDKNYLFDALIASIHQHPLQWRLTIMIGQPGDPTNDATIPWPDTREQVDVGTLTLDRVQSEDTGPCRDINYDPLILPDGMAPSDDPLLSARSAVYSQSFTRRAGENKLPSAITPSEVQK
jgi:catalase